MALRLFSMLPTVDQMPLLGLLRPEVRVFDGCPEPVFDGCPEPGCLRWLSRNKALLFNHYCGSQLSRPALMAVPDLVTKKRLTLMAVPDLVTKKRLTLMAVPDLGIDR